MKPFQFKAKASEKDILRDRKSPMDFSTALSDHEKYVKEKGAWTKADQKDSGVELDTFQETLNIRGNVFTMTPVKARSWKNLK